MSFGVTGNPAEVWVRMDGQDNCFNVRIDGELVLSFKAKSGERDYLVARNVDREITLSIVKRSEAMNGMMSHTPVTVFNVAMPEGAKLVKPFKKNNRVIEFIGDSDSAAFGNLSPKTGVDMLSMLSVDMKNEDCEKGWIGLTASAFQADFHGIAISGTGAVWDSDGNKDNSIQKYYKRTLMSEDCDCERFEHVDLVIIYLGGNDYEGKLCETPSAEEEFIQGFCDLLNMVREARPDTFILCLLPGKTMPSALASKTEQAAAHQTLTKLIPKAIQRAGGKENKIDHRTNPAVLDLQNDSQWGSLLHWSTKGHQIVAYGAIDCVRDVMLWDPTLGWDLEGLLDDKFVDV
eukprot:TRINITY_DN7496_c1_g1_i2.p1 TRINITY_DN7496_c1_g1~~TRINITY_DN7496_c1_g1_i2.p1  ORF type:complete len:390 (-),score=45.77 TRINITY_DN7496_c1_g1_i2:271-1311(-)